MGAIWAAPPPRESASGGRAEGGVKGEKKEDGRGVEMSGKDRRRRMSRNGERREEERREKEV